MKKETNKYRLLTTIRYLGDGFFYPFFSLYLTSNNYTESTIGILLSITPLLGVLLNPIYSHICKNANTTKKILGIVSIFEGLMILFTTFTTNLILISIITVLMAIFGACHYAMMDSILTIYSNNNKITYSSLRIFGSIAYIFATTLGGIVCDEINFQVAFLISNGLFIISGMMYLLLDPIEEIKIEEKEHFSFSEFFKNKNFVLFLIFFTLMFAVHQESEKFFATYLYSRGVTTKDWGFIYSYLVMGEVITLIILNKIKIKSSPLFLLILSCFCLIIRMLIYGLYLPIGVVIACSIFRGIGYAMCLHAMTPYIVELVGKKRAIKGIMLVTLFYSTLAFLLTNGAGYIIEDLSYSAFYYINVGLAVIALIIGLLNYRYQNKEPTEK